MSVLCGYPVREDYSRQFEPPEGFDEWRPLSGFCNHIDCQTADYYRRVYGGALTREEKEEMEADTELMRDEFHGRGVDGRIR